MLNIIRGVEIARRGDCIVTMTTTPVAATLELLPSAAIQTLTGSSR